MLQKVLVKLAVFEIRMMPAKRPQHHNYGFENICLFFSQFWLKIEDYE